MRDANVFGDGPRMRACCSSASSRVTRKTVPASRCRASGRLLMACWRKVGIDRSVVYVTNASAF